MNTVISRVHRMRQFTVTNGLVSNQKILQNMRRVLKPVSCPGKFTKSVPLLPPVAEQGAAAQNPVLSRKVRSSAECIFAMFCGYGLQSQHALTQKLGGGNVNRLSQNFSQVLRLFDIYELLEIAIYCMSSVVKLAGWSQSGFPPSVLGSEVAI